MCAQVYGEWLLKKHFFRLFLHWDYNIRSIFHQILIFKARFSASRFALPARIRSTHLRADGAAEEVAAAVGGLSSIGAERDSSLLHEGAGRPL